LKNSTNTRTRTINNDLDPQDIASIIQSCKDAGVRELQFKGLNISFGTLPETKKTAAELRDEQVKMGARGLEIEELRMIEDRIEQLKIEDPEEYERLILSGELKRDPDKTIDED
jgi:hypothetical protein